MEDMVVAEEDTEAEAEAVDTEVEAEEEVKAVAELPSLESV